VTGLPGFVAVAVYLLTPAVPAAPDLPDYIVDMVVEFVLRSR
jgi:hypothetical protein